MIAGTGTNDTRHAVHLTERATELGADAVLVVTPYYNRPSRRGLVRHYQAVASATDIADEIRARIRAETDLTASAGVSL